ncbi:hypothetical protein Trydic_g14854 [Trypoxylus dichotomus]
MRTLRRIITPNRRANYDGLSILWSQAIDKSFSNATCRRVARKLGFKTYKTKESFDKQKHRRDIALYRQNSTELSRGLNGTQSYGMMCLKSKVKFPPSIMIWGSMSAKDVGNFHFVDGIMTAEKYINVLQANLKSQIGEMCLNNIECGFQQDGATCDMAKNGKNCMSENILLLSWLSSSPDPSQLKTL